MISRAARQWRGTLAAALLAVYPVAWFLHPYLQEEDWSVCFFRTVTGRPCVFCGLTHAVACGVHGEWDMAYRHHPFWWLACFAMLAMAAILAVDAWRGSNRAGRAGAVLFRYRWPLTGGIAALSIARACWAGLSG